MMVMVSADNSKPFQACIEYFTKVYSVAAAHTTQKHVRWKKPVIHHLHIFVLFLYKKILQIYGAYIYIYI